MKPSVTVQVTDGILQSVSKTGQTGPHEKEPLEIDMKKSLITAALAAMLSTGTIAGASAMPVAKLDAPQAAAAKVQLAGHRHRDRYRDRDVRRHHGRHHLLPVRAVRRELRHRGYRHIRFVGSTRGDYLFIARGYRGPVRLLVDGRTARVLSRHRIRGHRGGPAFHHRSDNGNFSFSFGIY